MEEKDVLYVQQVKPAKKKFQFSKVITVFILAIITVTWLIGLFLYFDHIEYFNYLLDYVQACALGVMPYFCLSMMDRVQYIMQAKFQSEREVK